MEVPNPRVAATALRGPAPGAKASGALAPVEPKALVSEEMARDRTVTVRPDRPVLVPPAPETEAARGEVRPRSRVKPTF
jgi:hypothetical protein